MTAIEHLMEEHRTLESVLATMETWAETLETRPATENAAQLGLFASFLSDYVDPVHHRKEERVLFEALVEHGFPREVGPVAAMTREHDECRALMSRMSAFAAAPAPWLPEEVASVRGLVLTYVEHLSHHIFKEDNVLYPVASSQLPAERLVAMVAEFDAIDAAAGRTALLTRAAALCHPSLASAPNPAPASP